jgi:hypothetical protein
MGLKNLFSPCGGELRTEKKKKKRAELFVREGGQRHFSYTVFGLSAQQL